MCYVVLVATVLQYITEPCIQGVMANHVGADRQGSLQVSSWLRGHSQAASSTSALVHWKGKQGQADEQLRMKRIITVWERACQ